MVEHMNTTSRSRTPTVRGVATLVIGVLIGLAGCVSGPRIAPRDDAAITGDVRARLAADEQTKPFVITVDTKDGVVHVAGDVAKDTDRRRVERIAGDVPGVSAVNNDVRYGAVPVPVESSGTQPLEQ
jgi:osmotically-inducible protein OsmY